MNNKKIEIIANIVLTIVGLTLGIIFFMSEKENMKDLSLILFSIALASILYQFLGGIGEGNSFQLGAIKFGGAAAILIGFMFFFKKVVFVPTPENNLTISPEKDWVPISTETGKIKSVTISDGKESKTFPDPTDNTYLEERKQHEYQISKKNSSQFSIELKSRPQDTIGYTDINSFNNTGLYNTVVVAEDEKSIQVFELRPYTSINSSTKIPTVKLPFNIEVFQNSRFSIYPYYNNMLVEKKSSYLVPDSNKKNEFYIVFLEQADLRDTIPETDRYSKWLVKKMKYKLER